MNDKVSMHFDNGHKSFGLIKKAIAKRLKLQKNPLSVGKSYSNFTNHRSLEDTMLTNEELRLRNEILWKL